MRATEKRTTLSRDGVRIVYSAAGTGEPALVFIHGGLADRSFWDGQLLAFASRHRVIALDLAGHGESGRDRAVWGMPMFGHDVRAVVAAEKLRRAVLIGNSLGGSAAIEAAALLAGTAMGVVGVDTFHDLGRRIEPEEAKAQAEAWRSDYSGTLDQMIRALFHSDADPALLADVRRRMSGMSPDLLWKMFTSFAGYDTGATARALSVPVRTINGDLFPTDLAAIRRVVPGFEAVILPHTGHYPMLERPEEFNRRLAEAVAAISATKR